MGGQGARSRLSAHLSGSQSHARLMVVFTLAGLTQASCVNVSADQHHEGPRHESMSFDQLLQTDFNRTVTLAMRDNLDSLYRLQEKLYRRNPNQWRNAGHADLDAALANGRDAIARARPP